jgi:anti-sigma regulatory factor (Ser/Thr protein kinase)
VERPRSCVAVLLVLCYPAASVSGSEHAEALHQVCHLHSSVLHASAKQAERVTDAEIRAEFPAEHNSPGDARRLVVSALRERGYDDALVDDTALVLSELASNAILHADSPFSIEIRVENSMLRIAVEDTSRQAVARGDGLIARAGHGLGVIDVLCARWGVEENAGGKVVWAELAYEMPAGEDVRPGALST